MSSTTAQRTRRPRAGATPPTSLPADAAAVGAPEPVSSSRSRQILAALSAFRDGDFSVRLPGDWGDVDGEIAAAFNQITAQEARIAARVHGGLGLGLSIVKNLVELHGGEVSASSAGAGRGAAFVVRFPRASRSALPFESSDRPQAPVGDTVEPPIAGLRVLLVDDHADVLEVHARLLTEHDALVTTAESAEAALALLRARPFDVLLSDLGMPGLDGYDLIRRVRGELGLSAATLPAAAVTAFVRLEDRDAALGAGYQCCLQKPVSPVLLVRTVAQLGVPAVSAPAAPALPLPVVGGVASRDAGAVPLRTLFIEDNEDLREQTAWMLEEEGLQVRSFANAEDALACYVPEEVDVVVTDVSLPGMSGLDLARAILRRSPQAWVVFSSGYAMGNDLSSFGPHVRALLKPFDFVDIRRLVEEIRAASTA